ncbi:MAG: DUF4303 domain-containing protein [Lachnospiraceae bacterium]|nr:DUF4303 domain-containing protein [Lachnospiraceae bacterium]
MSEPIPETIVDVELVRLIENAAKKALTKLFDEHDENFYYITLATFGECVCPVISAWSVEALEREASLKGYSEDEKADLKWDYASSPYYAFGYDEFFGDVRKAFDARDEKIEDADDDEYDREMSIRLNSMEKAMQDLDLKGLFGQGDKRLGIVINAEYMPPDYSNTERAKRLNPEQALAEWLEEAAEVE